MPRLSALPTSGIDRVLALIARAHRLDADLARTREKLRETFRALPRDERVEILGHLTRADRERLGI